jgi:glycosyltransferase involved in cell wall biosynthesis
MLGLHRIIMREKPEIVHAHNWLVYSFLPLKVWSGARLVVTLHNQGLVCVKTTLLYQNAPCQGPDFRKCLDCAVQYYGLPKGVSTVLSHRAMSPALRSAVDMFLPVSQAVAAGNKLVGSQMPFRVIHNFIPNDISVPQGDLASYISQLPGEDYLLFVGALSHQKGIDVLLRAYAALTNAPPLVLIGYPTRDWPLLGVDCPSNVVVLKDWPRYAVMEAWRRSIIALLPSVGPESSPTVVMEAMSTGCPVVASRIGGVADLVSDGETGILVEPGDPLALRQAIELLLANPDLRKRMGQCGLRKVVEFQASTVVPRIEHVYEELLQEANISRENDLCGDSVASRRV